MSDAEPNPNPPDRLLVPIDVQALLVGKTEGEWLPVVPDFTGVFRDQFLGSQLERAIVAEARTDSLHTPGIHLHWALPDALCRGEATSEGLKMPAIPNRWLILRMIVAPKDTTSPVRLRAWIIESDYVASPDEDEAMTGNPWPSPRLGQSAGSEAQNSWVYVGKRFDYGGRGSNETQWTPGNSKNSLARSVVEGTKRPFSIKLTALGYGDPAFCASYSACKNLLAFHDKLDPSDEPGVLDSAAEDNPVDLTYLVAGWYADPADDPLYRYTAEQWSGCRLRLVSSEQALGEIPKADQKNLIVVAKADPVLFQIFDERGERVVDTDLGALLKQAASDLDQQNAIGELTKKLDKSWGRNLADGETKELIAAVISIVGHYRWKRRLGELGWKTIPESKAPLPLPTQVLCHGLIQRIQWQGEAVEYPVEDTSKPAAKVAIGNNDVEALTAALGAWIEELAEPDLADLFAAFQFDVLTGLTQPGGDHELTASLHERTFGRYPGGTRWEIVEPPRAAAPGNVGQSGKETATVVPEPVAQALRRLNDAQRRLDRTNQELRSCLEELYATWYKSVLLGDSKDANRTSSLQARLKWLREDAIPKRRNQLKDDGKERKTRDSLEAEVKAELDRFLPGFKLEQGSEPYFHVPNDPVVMISGGVARVSRRHGDDGRFSKDGKTLLCRFENQSIPSWTVRDPGAANAVKITGADLQKRAGSPGFPAGEPIPKAIEAKLFPEALLLEPGLTPFLAQLAPRGTIDRWTRARSCA